VTAGARETVLDCLMIRELHLQEQIDTWLRRGAKLSRKNKDGLIAAAREEIERIQAARREMMAEEIAQ
jgi:hypothetical protein